MPVVRHLHQLIKHSPGLPSARVGVTSGTLAVLMLAAAQPALAQRVVPKIGSICPLGLMSSILMPTDGEACLEGWMNVGGGYCRKK